MARKIIDRYRDYFEDFFYYTIFRESEVYDWRPGVHNELIVYLDDGAIVSYNCMSHNCAYIYRPDVSDDDMTDEESKERFADNLVRIMDKHFMTQRELSEKSGISQVSINKYVHGVSTPTIIHVKRLARALKCSVTDLIYFD